MYFVSQVFIPFVSQVFFLLLIVLALAAAIVTALTRNGNHTSTKYSSFGSKAVFLPRLALISLQTMDLCYLLNFDRI